jgi:hypothetical protein
MIPNVFVSSTVEDLLHLRDAVRDAIADLEYVPVLSDYGDVGYGPDTSAEESCYASIRRCHLAIVIVGKRYGSIGSGGLSVTQNEFNIARQRGIPIITLVNEEVLSFKKIFDANPDAPILFPQVEEPKQLFEFIESIRTSAVNNGILTYKRVPEARQHVKRQIAHLVGDMLEARTGKAAESLAEVKTLRHELSGLSSSTQRVDNDFLRAMTRMLQGRHQPFNTAVEYLFGDFEPAVEAVLQVSSFDDLVQKSNHVMHVDEGFDPRTTGKWDYSGAFLAWNVAELPNDPPQGKWAIDRDNGLWVNRAARDSFRLHFLTMKEAVGRGE